MTANEEGQWMRERFHQSMRDTPNSPAPHAEIVRTGRARRRRRTVVGVTAAVLAVTGSALGVGLAATGGPDGSTPPAAVGASNALPLPSASASAPVKLPTGATKPKALVAEGRFGTRHWEVMVSTNAVPDAPGYSGTPSPNPTGTPVDPQWCNYMWLQIDGVWAASAWGGCAAMIHVPDTGGAPKSMRHASGGGGSVFIIGVSAQVARVTGEFTDGTKLEATPVQPDGFPFRYVVFAAENAQSHGGFLKIATFDAAGNEINPKDRISLPNWDGEPR